MSSLMRCLFNVLPISHFFFIGEFFVYIILEFCIKGIFESLFSWPVSFSLTFLPVSAWDPTETMKIAGTWAPSLQTGSHFVVVPSLPDPFFP